MKQKNLMRNVQFLQNYGPAKFRIALSGKNAVDFSITDEMRTKEWWIARFEEAIDDLKHGYYINHRGLKNEVDYWRKQIKMVKEFVPRKEGDDGNKITD